MAKKESNRDLEFLQALEREKEKYDQIEVVDISSKMRTSFLDYSMSVIVARALPDVRDGLKPVQRRIIYGMNTLHIYAGTPFKKSARITGEVMGKYHPHGDSSIYDAMVRMAQPLSYRYPLVEGHGNFGNPLDGDGAAASRYTEARMSKISMEMVRDIDKDTVDFVPNYDGEEEEPVILPARIPNLLVNGATGIAVGMATNIPPHNLTESINAVLALMDNPEITVEELLEVLPGPDFPTGGLILGRQGLLEAYKTGIGTIVVRSKTDIVELANGKTEIIVTELPYMVNKVRLLDRIAELHKDKIIDGITDLRDESNDRNGVKVVIEVRKDANPHVILNQLFKYTQLQTTFGYNMIALVGGAPKTINLKEILEEYLKHQIEVITRRTNYDLNKVKARAHILEGLVIALENIDAIIELIKNSKDANDALEGLMNNYLLDDIQAREVLNTRLQRLTGLEVEKIKEEKEECIQTIIRLEDILAHEDQKLQIIRDELTEIRDKYKDKRLSEISMSTAISIEDEDLIPREEVLVTITEKGYAKRMKVSEYRAQGRGGKGLTGMKIHDDDFVMHMCLTNSHNYINFFTNKGRVYKEKAYNIIEGTRISKGVPLVNVIALQEDETLQSVCPIDPNQYETHSLLFITKKGIVKRTSISLFKNIRSSGIIAIDLREGDELFAVLVVDGTKDIILGSSGGKAIRFSESDLRDLGRSASGVRGMKLDEGEVIVGAGIIESDEDDILVLSEKGLGKRTSSTEYRAQGRGGLGVKTINVTEKNGQLVCLKVVHEDEDIVATTNRGMVLRTHISEISQTGRNTQGVIIMRLNDKQRIATVAVLPKEEDEDEEIQENLDENVVENTVENTENISE